MSPQRCDACGKRRIMIMHPIGMDLCKECAARADDYERAAEALESGDSGTGGESNG